MRFVVQANWAEGNRGCYGVSSPGSQGCWRRLFRAGDARVRFWRPRPWVPQVSSKMMRVEKGSTGKGNKWWMQSCEASLLLETYYMLFKEKQHKLTLKCSPFAMHNFKYSYLQTQLSLIMTLWSCYYQHLLLQIKNQCLERFGNNITQPVWSRPRLEPRFFDSKAYRFKYYAPGLFALSRLQSSSAERHANSDWHSWLCLSGDNNSTYYMWRG